MTASGIEIEERIDRLHAPGLVDLHFDLLMDLYEKRGCTDVLTTKFLPEFEAGNMAVLGAAIYIEDRYLPEMALRVALDQIARLYAEVEMSDRFAICKSFQGILRARKAGKIVLLITMEGVEPLGVDLNLLRVFFSGATCFKPVKRSGSWLISPTLIPRASRKFSRARPDRLLCRTPMRDGITTSSATSVTNKSR
jgi:hypothetical protein